MPRRMRRNAQVPALPDGSNYIPHCRYVADRPFAVEDPEEGRDYLPMILVGGDPSGDEKRPHRERTSRLVVPNNLRQDAEQRVLQSQNSDMCNGEFVAHQAKVDPSSESEALRNGGQMSSVRVSAVEADLAEQSIQLLDLRINCRSARRRRWKLSGQLWKCEQQCQQAQPSSQCACQSSWRQDRRTTRRV